MRILIILVLLLFYSCNQTTAPQWHLVYKHDAQGNAITGSKEDLKMAVRQGLPIRIGWGRANPDRTRSIEHVADAQFLSILDGQEVFAQISPIRGQAPFGTLDSMGIQFRPENIWTTIKGSNGYSSNLMFNYVADTLNNMGNERPQGISWYAFYSNLEKVKPYFD